MLAADAVFQADGVIYTKDTQGASMWSPTA